MKYEPNYESLSMHEMPSWFDEAKLGIFIHWGLYSIPAFAEPSNINELIRKIGHGRHYYFNPYAEWYMNTYQLEGTAAYNYHMKKYGRKFTYYNFQSIFEKESKTFHANELAHFIKDVGAKYVVMVTKHHDGYALWPSKHRHKILPDYYSKRDFVGEVTESVRNNGLKMGLYYSGVLDWSYRYTPIKNSYTFAYTMNHEREYIEYATNQFIELIDRYRPSILWNDVGYPYGYDVNKLFAYYYNKVADGVINDRFGSIKIPKNPLLKPIIKLYCWHLDKKTKGLGDDESKYELWYDFNTPEYSKYELAKEKKWEMNRGIGYSFGYNQCETEDRMLTGRSLIHMLIDVVSKNGNLLINIGPKPDGTISQLQKQPLMELGKWLKINGEAIYKTSCHKEPAGITVNGMDIRYTRKGNTLYVILLDEVHGNINIKNLRLNDNATITILDNDTMLDWYRDDNNIIIEVPDNINTKHAVVLKVCAFE